MTLNEVMTQTADAIREKTGKTELIAPVNFAEEIKSISAGGGESGRTIYVRYEKGTQAVSAVLLASIVKARASNEYLDMVSIIPSLMIGILETQYTVETLAFTLDLDTRVVIGGSGSGIDGTIESTLAAQGVDINTLPRITEAEFYDLNA